MHPEVHLVDMVPSPGGDSRRTMPYEFIYLRRSFITGTMRAEAAYTRMLFLTLLFENTHGVITATPDFLASISGLSEEAVNIGLERLSAPDPNSTSTAEDGRRIVPVEGKRNTWRIVNWAVYQPALTSPDDDPNRPPRRLPDGSDNPAYWSWIKKRQRQAAKAGHAIEKELGSMSGMSTVVVDGGAAKERISAPAGALGGHNGGQIQVQNMPDVHLVHPNKSKPNESSNNPLSPPEEVSTTTGGPEDMMPTVQKPKRTRVPSRKAIDSRGKREYDEPWSRFDKAYPRRPDGRSINRAEARLIFDALLDAGENAEDIVAGCERYAAYLKARRETKYIKMMSTWLNGRCWEESFYIHPESDLGREIAQREADERKAARYAHEKAHENTYRVFLDSLVDEWLGEPGVAEEWEADARDTLERRKKMGLSGAIRMAEEALTVPEKRLESMRSWMRERRKEEMPSFWEWDAQHNPEGFEVKA